jgi:hypothetical protein
VLTGQNENRRLVDWRRIVAWVFVVGGAAVGFLGFQSAGNHNPPDNQLTWLIGGGIVVLIGIITLEQTKPKDES